MLPYVFAKGNKKTLEKLKALRKQAQADKAPRVALRIQGVMLSLEKYSVNDIARLLHVHRSAVHSWIAAWNEHREFGLMEGHRSGRPPKMSDEHKQRLADIVDSGPVAYGLNSGVWTSPMISQIIQEEFRVTYHQGHVRKLLKQLGFSVQSPTTQLMQADPKKQNKWTRYTFPNLKKKSSQKARR